MEVKVYTALFLEDDDDDRVLMLQRDEGKSFAPNQYTGVGGKVETEDINLESALQREWKEETRIPWELVQDMRLMGSLLVNRGDVDNLVYYLRARYGGIADEIDLWCDEGRLEWVHKDDLSSLDWIPTARAIHDYLKQDSGKRFHCWFNVQDESYQIIEW